MPHFRNKQTGDVCFAMQLPKYEDDPSEELIDFIAECPDRNAITGTDVGGLAIKCTHPVTGQPGMMFADPEDWLVRSPRGNYLGISNEEFAREFEKIEEN